MLRILFTFLIPACVFGLCWGAVGPLGLLPPQYLRFAPYVAALVAALVCWRFRRSRAVPVLVLAMLGCWFLGLLAQPFSHTPLFRLVFPAFTLLIPCNVLIASFIGDRGCFTAKGLSQLGLYAGEALVVLAVATHVFGAYDPIVMAPFTHSVDAFLHYRVFPASWDHWTYLSQPTMLVGLVAIGVLLGKGLLHDDPMDVGLAIGVFGLLAMFHSIGSVRGPQAVCVGTCLALAAPLLQESYRMAFLDELTGLPARRALLSDFSGLSGKYCLVMADIDHFKKFNDTYGHDTGDEVLRMVASHLGQVAGGGRAYRYGGEEFTIIFSRKDAEEAFPYADEVRQAIEQAHFTVRQQRKTASSGKNAKTTGKRVSVTISMGLAESTSASDPLEVLKVADKALYKAKKKGRNRVEKGS